MFLRCFVIMRIEYIKYRYLRLVFTVYLVIEVSEV